MFERERMGRRIFSLKIIATSNPARRVSFVVQQPREVSHNFSFSAVCPGYDVKSTLATRIRERERRERTMRSKIP